MNSFRFHVATDIRFGSDQLQHLPGVLAEYGKRVLLTYGGGSIKQFGLYDEVIKLLNHNEFHIVELSGIEPNPRIESVYEGVKLIREHELDVILAVGGGSVIDASKVMAAGVYYEGDAWDLMLDSAKIGRAVPLVNILTLAATGTEMNRNAVISNLNTNEKLGAKAWELLPKASFLDPTNTFTVSAYQTAAGVADTLSHLFEQYFNRTAGVEVQNNIAEGLMKAVFKYGPIALEKPNDYEARANLLWASTLSLNGLPSVGKTGGWTCHPIEHVWSAHYDITHAIGLAILTPRWMKHCMEVDQTTHTYFATYGRNVFGITEENDEVAAYQAMEKTYHFFKNEMKIPMTLPEVGITTDEKVDLMSKQAVDGGLNTTNPFVSLTAKDVAKITHACFLPMVF